MSAVTPLRRKLGECTNTGHTGELLVAAELALRGWVVGSAPRGNASFDLFADHRTTGEHRLIQVKTAASGPDYSWQAKPQPESHSLDHLFYALVKLPKFENERAFFWIVPSAYVHAHTYQYVRNVHTAGAPFKASHWFGPSDVKPESDNWGVLKGEPFQPSPAAERYAAEMRARKVAAGG